MELMEDFLSPVSEEKKELINRLIDELLGIITLHPASLEEQVAEIDIMEEN